MELLYKACAEIDIGKKYALVTIRFAGAGRRKTRYSPVSEKAGRPQDWLPDDPGPEADSEPSAVLPPKPGTGYVWVIEVKPGRYHASWQSDDGGPSFDGDRADTLAWARAQPALGVKWSEGGSPHVDLP
jgi:hypothetical protein